MKNFLIYASFSILAGFTACNQQSNEAESVSTESLLETTDKVLQTGKAGTAIEYNDAIVGLQAKIIQEMLVVLNLQGKDPVADLKHLTQTIIQSRNQLKTLQIYDGGLDLKKSADELFAFYQSACEGPWLKAFELYAAEGEKMSDEQSQQFLTLLEEGSANEKQFDDAFAIAQEAFSKQHGFSIVENELQGKIDQAGE
jgi:hypothetical protein